jgi:hypothetical protein
MKAGAKGFAFVGMPIDIRCPLPFEISDRLVLKPANDTQRRRIKRYLSELGGHCDNRGPFERAFTKTPELDEELEGIDAFSYESKRLPLAEWRYYVVAFPNAQFAFGEGCKEITLLRIASHLTEHSLRLSPVYWRGVWSSDVTSDWEYFTDIAGTGGDLFSCDQRYLEDVRHCYSAILRLSSTHPDIARSIRMYDDVPNRRGYSELTTLGLFAVLESLLTHNPRGEHDSIGHQIRKKVALVEKRARNPIGYDCFGKATADTIWSKLYEFRSRLAHGGTADFDKSLSLLNDAYTVEVFMKNTLRVLLRGAMEEPDLYADLRSV